MYEELLKKVEHMQFKMDLLYEGTELSRFLYENDITKEQNNELNNLMQEYRNMIDNRKEVFHGSFEDKIYKIVPQIERSFHFCEDYARLCWKEEKWEEIFPTLYGEELKYQSLFNK